MIGLVEQVPLGSTWFPKEGAKGVSQRIQVIGYVDETYADPILEVVRTRGTGTRDKGQLRVSGLLAKYERRATR